MYLNSVIILQSNKFAQENKMLDTVISYLPQHPFFVTAVLLFVTLAVVWNLLRKRKMPVKESDIPRTIQPLPLHFVSLDYLKALVSWIFLFMRVFSVKPGLYYIGQRDEKAPIIVTANNYLTVFLLARRIGKRNVRLLIIDTRGINVWCAAGKGQFSSGEIIDKATYFELLNGKNNETFILPKFSFAGVNLAELRKNGIHPIIGPLYAKDVPSFLDQETYENQVDDIVKFGLKSRAFTALPTAVQFFYYFLGIYVISLGTLTPAIIWIATGLAFIYPLLFPMLPGKFFAVKGIFMALSISIFDLLVTNLNLVNQLSLIIFLFATSIFIALSYTGNSAVSNYTSVRKETARFLPVVVFLYILLIPLHYLKQIVQFFT